MTKRTSWTELKATTPLTEKAQAAYDDEVRNLRVPSSCLPSPKPAQERNYRRSKTSGIFERG